MRETTLCYIERDGRYLMLHRTKKENDVNKDKWIGVGGGFEADESPEDCMKREIFEETSLNVTLDTTFRAEYRYLVDGYIHKSALYFLANYTEGSFRPQAGEVFGIWLLPYEDAIEKLDYEQDRRVLRMAEKRLAADEQKNQQ